MDGVLGILLWLHLVALAAAGAASFGLPLAGRVFATAPLEAQPSIGEIRRVLMKMGPMAYATLVVTGILLWRLGHTGAGGWFWVKVGLVVILGAGIFLSRKFALRAMAGDADAGRRLPALGRANVLLFLAVIACAVAAFG